MVSITLWELQRIIAAINSHIETCDDFLTIDLSKATREAMEDQRRAYVAIREKLQAAHDAGDKLIEVTYATVPKYCFARTIKEALS